MWESKKIGDVVDIRRGASPRPIQNYLSAAGMPWVKISDATSDHTRFINKTNEYIIESGVKHSVIVQPDTLIVSNSATPGLPKIMKITACVHDGWLVFDNYRGVIRDYLYYKFIDIRRHLVNQANGSVFQNLKTDIVRSFDIMVPPIDVQEKIVSILSTLDMKIEANDATNDNLLQQAKAIFNDRYDSAEEQCHFTSLIHVFGGGTPKTGNPEFWNGDIPFFTPKDVGSPYTVQTEKTITAAGLEHCNSRLYPANTSFVTARGTVGKVSLAGKPMAMNQSCYALTSDSIDPILVYFYTLRAVESLKHKASGAVFDAIVARDFETEVVSVISETESKAILALITPMMKAIHSNVEGSIYLAALRDALLPRLMSGEIDVSNISL